MIVKVKYFGRLRELLDVKEELYEVEDGTNLANLLFNHVPERHPDVSEEWRGEIFRMVKGKVVFEDDGLPILKNYYILVNGRSSNLDYRLRDGDEVAILPPVGGG